MTESTNAPQPVPIKYAGLVIAWESEKRERIVASGVSFDDARAAAQAAGVSDPPLERVPHRTKRFIGRVA